ncbi:MAG: hypothetical protein AABY22_06215 [Nanoarchaeota archaeon]
MGFKIFCFRIFSLKGDNFTKEDRIKFRDFFRIGPYVGRNYFWCKRFTVMKQYNHPDY